MANNNDNPCKDDPIQNPQKYGSGTVTVAFQRLVRQGPATWDFSALYAQTSPPQVTAEDIRREEERQRAIRYQREAGLINNLVDGFAGKRTRPLEEPVPPTLRSATIQHSEENGYFQLSGRIVNINSHPFDLKDSVEDENAENVLQPFFDPLEERLDRTLTDIEILDQLYCSSAVLVIDELLQEVSVEHMLCHEVTSQDGDMTVFVVSLGKARNEAVYQISDENAVLGTGIISPAGQTGNVIREIMKYLK